MQFGTPLLKTISSLPTRSIQGDVYRATVNDRDPTVFASGGGRWMPYEADEGGRPILYTSLSRDGALAEVASVFTQLSPVPSKTHIRITRLRVAIDQVVTIAPDDLVRLGIDPARYQERSYDATQVVGAAVCRLGYSGLVAPNARWPAQNLMIFRDHYDLDAELEVAGCEDVPAEEWKSLAGQFR